MDSVVDADVGGDVSECVSDEESDSGKLANDRPESDRCNDGREGEGDAIIDCDAPALNELARPGAMLPSFDVITLRVGVDACACNNDR